MQRDDVGGAREPVPGGQVLAPAYVITPAETFCDRCLVIGADGRCRGLLPRAEAAALGITIAELPRRALLPGFVNAHSHVFQRRLRGRTHDGGAARDSFWTWREQMYGEAALLDPDTLYTTARGCYAEMLRAGYTAVGEFHYIHHAPDGRPYDDHLAMSRAIIAAASDVGIRLVLLPAAYARGGFDSGDLRPAQRRFLFAHVDHYLRFVDDLRALSDGAVFRVGVAPHSVRALPESWLAAIGRYAAERALVLHVHASEQVAEVRDTRAQHGCPPIELLARCGLLGPRATVVHATHATAHEIGLLAAAQATVCVCPTTEGDLGDGVAPYASFARRRLALAIGSDGQTRLDPFEELRWAEFSARLRYRRRRILAPGAAAPAATLLAAGTQGGARSLGVAAGTLDEGAWADLLAVDLDHPAIVGASPATLRDVLIFGAGADVVSDVWVGGRRVYTRP